MKLDKIKPRDRNRPGEYLKRRRRSLRLACTKGEYALWLRLRNKEFKHKFRRQVSIGPYIVDFYCHLLKLVIEVNGGIHNERVEYDNRRDAWLRKQGYNVVRVKNEDCIYNAETVLVAIKQAINEICKSR